mmetsp:Transcript_31815/g.99014  ORF Transcript_31815/g.99014 Transcript_31815/m.99014 type:complete len:332 (-) Transcript_31815:2-997(-)
MPQGRQAGAGGVLDGGPGLLRALPLLREGLGLLGLAVRLGLGYLRHDGLDLAVQLLQEGRLLRGRELALVDHALQLRRHELGLLPELLRPDAVEEGLLLCAELLQPGHLALDVLQGRNPRLQQVQDLLLLGVGRDVVLEEPPEVLVVAPEEHLLGAARLVGRLLLLLLPVPASGGRARSADLWEDVHELQVLARVVLELVLAAGALHARGRVVVHVSDGREGGHQLLWQVVGVLLPHELAAPDHEGELHHLRQGQRLGEGSLDHLVATRLVVVRQVELVRLRGTPDLAGHAAHGARTGRPPVGSWGDVGWRAVRPRPALRGGPAREHTTCP